MAKYSDRLDTFYNAPYCLSQTLKQRLARAGFYSLGKRDHVKCFECKLVLEDINYNECFYAQHAFWSPTCEWILNRRGHKFVDDVLLNGRIKNSRYEDYTFNEIGILSISKEINDEIIRQAKKEESALQKKVDCLRRKYKKIQDDNNQLSESKKCIICCDNDRNTVFMNCRHLSCCDQCTVNLSECPICKAEIVMQIKIFIC